MNEIPRIDVWLEHELAKVPEVAYHNTSAGFDFFSIEDVIIEPGKTAKVENGVRLHIPEGYYLRFNARSSFGYVKDTTVYHGVLDAGWTGNMAVKLINYGDEPVEIKVGQKYAQAELLKLNPFEFNEVSKEEFAIIEQNAIRGQKGYGSSGK